MKRCDEFDRSTLLRRALAALQEWQRRSRSRRELRSLSEQQLKDIGLESSQAAFESGKPFFAA